MRTVQSRRLKVGSQTLSTFGSESELSAFRLRLRNVNILAIDQGTSATKALVVSSTGEILAEAEVPVHPKTVGDGGVEQDPEQLWTSVLAAAGQAVARAAARDIGRPLARLRVDGGLTHSRVLMQSQADLLQVPVEVYPSPHATAIGVAALARLGARAAPTPADAIGTWQPAAIFEPQVTADEAEARLQRWRRVAEATMSLPS